MAGTAWTIDPMEDFFLLSFTLVTFDLSTEEDLRAGVRLAISKFDQRKETAVRRRHEAQQREQRRLERQSVQAAKVTRRSKVSDVAHAA